MKIPGCLIAMGCLLAAQPVSSYRFTAKGDEKTVEVTNVTYETTNSLVLRVTAHSKRSLGEPGMEGTVITEAWKFGADLKTKPIYSVTVEGTESHIVEDALFVVSRGLNETDWWSVYKVANGAHLFDTYTPLLKFSISRETLTLRYVGLEVPGDDVKDARLKDPHVVGVLTYASDAKVIREALITCDDLKLAPQLRAFADESRTLTESGGKSLRLTFTQNFPSPPSPVTLTIPVAGDDLDLVHATLAPKVHVAAWKR